VKAVNKARHLIRLVGALLLGVAVAGAPALTYAQHSVGGGGGGHFSAGGGAHFSGGGGGAHLGGGFAGHAMGGPHFAAGGGPHFAAGGRYYGGFGGGARYAAPHFAAPRVAVHGGVRAVAPGIHTVAPGVAGHPGYYGHPGTVYAPAGHGWYGGYWHGAYWPHVWYHPGYAWWLPVLPIGYATYWWAGVPYYYWNNVYYVWNPGYNGYIVTDPPPVATDSSADASADQYEQAAPPPAQYSDQAPPPAQAYPPATGGGGTADLYLYPRNGQSEAQQQNDRYECHGWAVSQTGFDPTHGGPQPGSQAEYRKAMIACLDARGYSAR